MSHSNMSTQNDLNHTFPASLAYLRRRWWIWGAFLISGFVAIFAAGLALWGLNSENLTNTIPLLMLGVNIVPIAVIAWFIFSRLRHSSSLLSGHDNSSPLLDRFILLFSASAFVPAIIIALFLGISVSFGFNDWFSDRIKNVVESSEQAAQSYVDEEAKDIRDASNAMANDLNFAAQGFKEDRAQFDEYFSAQVIFRDLQAAFLINRKGMILLASQNANRSLYSIPSEETFLNSRHQVIVAPSVDQHNFKALRLLTDFDDAYLYIVRGVEDGLLERLSSAEASLASFRQSEERRLSIQLVFGLSYAEIVALIILGSIGFGALAARQMTSRIAALRDAALDVKEGELQTRVDDNTTDELGELARAFNAMTGQLSQQHKALSNARQDAQARSEFIETVLSEVKAGILRLDKNMVVTLHNAHALEYFKPAKKNTSTPVLPETLRQSISDTLDDRSPRETDLKLVTAGQARDLHVKITPEQAPREGVVLTIDDRSRLIMAQRMAAWRDVARRIAHEMRNPLTPIQFSIDRLTSKFRPQIDQDLDTYDQCTQIISRQVGSIAKMVEEFSDFARMPGPQLEKCDLAEVISQACKTQDVASTHSKVAFKAKPKSIEAFCDKRMIAQAVINLIKNAQEAIEGQNLAAGQLRVADERAESKIHVKLEKFGRRATLTIEDEGPGLREFDGATLMEPYMTTRSDGTGLGLAIAQRIFSEHAGELTIANYKTGKRSGARVTARWQIDEFRNTRNSDIPQEVQNLSESTALEESLT